MVEQLFIAVMPADVFVHNKKYVYITCSIYVMFVLGVIQILHNVVRWDGWGVIFRWVLCFVI
jgi:hypothetical protein